MVLHRLFQFFHAGRRREFAAGLERAIAGPAPSPGSDGAAPSDLFAPWLLQDSTSRRKRCFHPTRNAVGQLTGLTAWGEDWD